MVDAHEALVGIDGLTGGGGKVIHVGEARARQLLERALERPISFGVRTRQAGEGIEDVMLERRPLIARKGELDPVIGRALGDEALRGE